MTTYRNALPTELVLPSLALGRPLEAGEEFDSDEELVLNSVEVKQGDTWYSTVALAEEAAAELADAEGDAEGDTPKPARRARRTAKRTGGRS